MKKQIIQFACFAFIGISLVACKKETTSQPQKPVDANAPTLLITTPTMNFKTNIGGNFSTEGLANDNEGLSKLYYTIQTPNASYNYTQTDSMDISGTSFVVNKNIAIPTTASVGPATITYYVKDKTGNNSLPVDRNFTIEDKIAPNFTHYVDSLTNNDSLDLLFYRNNKNIVDSISIFNVTKNKIVGKITDVGGIKKIIVFHAEFETYYNAKTYDLTTGISKCSFAIKTNNTNYSFTTPYFAVELYQYDQDVNKTIEGTGDIQNIKHFNYHVGYSIKKK